MEAYASNSTKVPALSRTWDTFTSDRMDGAVVQTRRHTVTLRRIEGEIEAIIDGIARPLRDAVNILNGADSVTVTREELAPQPVGNVVGCELHRTLARAGVPSKEHYGYASAALDLPVYSLALLTADQVAAVLAFLAFTHAEPEATEVAEVAA